MFGSNVQLAPDRLPLLPADRAADGVSRDRDSWLARGRTVFAIAALLAVGILAFTAWIVSSDYNETRAGAEQSLSNIAGTLNKDIARNIELYNLALEETIDAIPLPGLANVSPEIRQAALFSRIATAEYMSAISVVDASGNVVATSAGGVLPIVNTADREYFQYLRDHKTDHLYISKPLLGRLNGKPSLVFARRLDAPDGSFAGVVAGSVELDYFRGLFSSLNLGEGGAVSLLRTDGYVLARYPIMPAEDARNLAGTQPTSDMLKIGAGVIDGVSAIDGTDRIYAYQRVGTLPLLVTVSYGKDAVLAGWRRKAVLVLSAIAALVGTAGLLLFGLRRQLALRTRAERQALASAERAMQSEHSLALSLDRLDAIFQHAADIQFAASPREDGHFAFDLLNPRCETLTGLPASLMLGRTPEECMAPEVGTVVQQNWDGVLQSGEPASYEHTLDLPIGRRHTETHLVPVLDTFGTVCRLIGTTRDVTHRKQAEEMLRQLNHTLEHRAATATAAHDHALQRASAAERLQVLGQLASGIAHDVNNVLQSVAGCAAMIERRADEPESMRRAGRLMADAAERGTAVTQRLLAFARDEAGAFERVRVAPMLADLADMLRHTLRSAGPLEIRADCADEALTVFADAKQLETVLLNLATNARDAMPGGGALVLGAEAVDEPPPSMPRGDCVRLWVQDDGTGIDVDILSRVTEPFFTTKPVGEGTGLGLSMAAEFARVSGGLLSIDSEPGRGTTVSLFLPR